jgi:hypothetical protein
MASREQPNDVLEQAQPGRWDHIAKCSGDLTEQPPFVIGAPTSTGLAGGLAWKACCQHIDGLNSRPIDRRHIAQVRDVGVAVSEDLRRTGVVVAHPRNAAAEQHLYRVIQSAVTAKEGTNSHDATAVSRAQHLVQQSLDASRA